MIKNPSDVRWTLLTEDGGAIPVSMYLLDSWFHDWDAVLALLGSMKNGRPAELLMAIGEKTERCRLIHHSHQTGRSTFKNPYGRPDPIVPLLTSETA